MDRSGGHLGHRPLAWVVAVSKRTVEVFTRYRHAAGPGETSTRQGARAKLDLVESKVLDIRGRIPADIPFVTNSWLQSYRSEMRGVGNDVYYLNHHDGIERLWASENVVWLVACWPKDPSYIMGWLCAEATDAGPVVHYIYVRHSVNSEQNLRGLGIATRLVETFLQGSDDPHKPAHTIWHTHSTPASRAALSGRAAPQPGAPGWVYNPYLFMRRLP